jgi:signal transduction histidine kinase
LQTIVPTTTVAAAGPTTGRTRLLLVEDNPGDADLVREYLCESDYDADVTHVETLGDALHELGRASFDGILLDLSLPDSFGMETVTRMRAVAHHIPTIVLTGSDDRSLALRMLREGVQEYVVKGELDRRSLRRAIEYAIEREALLSALEKTRAEQLRYKDQFLSQVSHEFRTPLTCIEQFTEIVLGGISGSVSQDQREYLEIILRNARQLHHMINDVLDVTRAEAGKLELQITCMDLREVVDEAIEDFKAAAESEFIHLGWNERPQHACLGLADHERVLQVLTNLIDNALKFTRAGGSVTLSVAEDQQDGSMARISVADTGCGISPGARRLVFDRLYQETPTAAARRGLGLGLYICQQIVARHGGRIWADSQSGEGSVLSFTLPRLSLPQLLKPLLRDDHEDDRGLAVLTVEVTPVWQTSSSSAWSRRRNEIDATIRDNLASKSVVVLPANSRLSDAELIFVITSLSEMNDVSRAIAQQFSSSDLGQSVVAKIRCSAVSQPAEQTAERVADAVWAMMAEESNRRRAN